MQFAQVRPGVEAEFVTQQFDVSLIGGQGVRLSTRPVERQHQVMDEALAERLCLDIAKEFPRSTFFAGKIIFQRERWYHWLLHNNTANAVQKRLHWVGRTMVILPARLR